MKKKCKLLPLLLCGACLLSSAGCAPTVSYQENLHLYVVNNVESKKSVVPTYRDGFTILQFTDIHWSIGTQVGNDEYGQVAYLKALVAETERHTGAKVDLIEITGDTFMLSNASYVTAFINTMEQIAVPYAITWGNHDRQGTYLANWMYSQFENAEHCLYVDVKNDDVAGDGNYVLNLDQDGSTKWQVFHMDSGASYREGAVELGMTYDYIRQSQLDWLSASHKSGVPSLAYFHIAQKDFKTHFDNAKKGVAGYKAKFFKTEGFGASKADGVPMLEDTFVANDVKGAFIGHCHSNDLTVQTPSGTVYGFGVKTGKELYYATIQNSDMVEGKTVFQKDSLLDFEETFDLVGASLVTLRDSGTFELEHLYYNERGHEDFVKWVKF